jgi:hypothetical protein
VDFCYFLKLLEQQELQPQAAAQPLAAATPRAQAQGQQFAALALLRLSPWEFDQTRSGWRSLPHAQGIQALRAYLQAHERDWDTIQEPIPREVPISGLYWHLGQLLAFEGNYREAIQWMQKSFDDKIMSYDNDHESHIGTIQWNNYVSGTVAFLKKDAKTLTRCAQMATGQHGQVLNSLLQGLKQGLSYKDAY